MNKFILPGKLATIATAVLLTGALQAQISVPAPSPAASVTQRIGIVDAKAEYSRPSAKGRKIFGELLTYGKIWRTGANAPTKLTFSDSVTIGGKKIPGGTYALYTIPTETSWTIILNTKVVQAGEYKDGDEAVKFTATPDKLTAPVESFTIDFANLGYTSAEVVLSWETTAVKFKVDTDPDKKIMAEIKSKMESTDLYWQSANYYYDANKDLKQALEWVNKVVEKNPRYWTIHLKAKILAKLGDNAGALEAANKSKELAMKDNDDAYIKLNDKLIAGLPAAPAKKK